MARFGALLLTGLVLLLVVYPSGHRPGGRAGRAGAVAIALSAILPIGLQLAPDRFLFEDTALADRLDVLHTGPLAVPMSGGLAIATMVLGQAAMLTAVVIALTLLVVRHGRAEEHERTQLRWLLWAGILCVLAVVIVLAIGTGNVVTDVALALAVVSTAASVTIGVVRPQLADVDSLVAGTLTFAGVAGTVVAIDLAVLAAARSLVGDRLDEGDVTLLVLVLAVGVYGPLRTWLSGQVRRLLFGRRADRYRVVSSFAARLEETRSVEEQLPALASAVAAAFKLAFVRVEIVHPGGGSISASRGEPGADAQVLDIAYGGERIGRLEVPRHGLRAMLSSRDQGLLLDLVRQGAIAIRTSLLAEEVQESRERLVLAREEDRRRIRRDLHDGLGPALGGVAMRLDAAGNAVESNPESAIRLIRQSRTELRDALDDVRRLVHDLRPPALDDLGLLAAVRQQAERAGADARGRRTRDRAARAAGGGRGRGVPDRLGGAHQRGQARRRREVHDRDDPARHRAGGGGLRRRSRHRRGGHRRASACCRCGSVPTSSGAGARCRARPPGAPRCERGCPTERGRADDRGADHRADRRRPPDLPRRPRRPCSTRCPGSTWWPAPPTAPRRSGCAPSTGPTSW